MIKECKVYRGPAGNSYIYGLTVGKSYSVWNGHDPRCWVLEDDTGEVTEVVKTFFDYENKMMKDYVGK